VEVDQPGHDEQPAHINGLGAAGGQITPDFSYSSVAEGDVGHLVASACWVDNTAAGEDQIPHVRASLKPGGGTGHLDDKWAITDDLHDIFDVKLWDLVSGTARSLPGFDLLDGIHGVGIGLVTIIPGLDGSSGLVTLDDRSVEGWVQTGGPVRLNEIQDRMSPAPAVALNTSGTMIATSSYARFGGGVQLSVLKDGGWVKDEFLTTMGETIDELAFSGNGQYLIGKSEEGDAFVWNTFEAPYCGTVLRLDEDTVQFIRFSPDGSTIFAATEGKIRSWETAALFDVEARTLGFEKAVYDQMPGSVANCLSMLQLGELGLLAKEAPGDTTQYRAHRGPAEPAPGKHLCPLAVDLSSQ
jgi:hypothetical protein